MKKFLIIILLLCLAILPFTTDVYAAKKKQAVRTLEITTKDEVILNATLYLPETATAKNKVPLVLLLHSLGSDKNVYTALATSLKSKNIAVLALDLRGHGKSISKMNGKKTYWQSYSNKTFAKYPQDINDVFDFIKSNYLGINITQIGVLGADLSANAAVVNAAEKKYNIKTMVLISPSLNFKGLSTPTNMVKYGNHPVMMIVDGNDKTHYNQARELEKYAQGQVSFITTKNGGTGDNIIKLNPYLNNTITTWFLQKL